MSNPKPWNQNAQIRGALRRAFSRSPIVREVMKANRKEYAWTTKDGKPAKRPAVRYLCAICREWVPSTKVSVDHKIPVIEVSDVGFVDWNTFVSRLFCDASNLQTICETCHNAKTQKERRARQAIKDAAILKVIETKINAGNYGADLKKELKKFTTKTKAVETVEKAKLLIARIVLQS